MTKRLYSSHSHPILPRLILAAVIALVALPASAAAQHFGRNKVQYDKFDFKFLLPALRHLLLPGEAARPRACGFPSGGRPLSRRWPPLTSRGRGALR